MHEAVVEDGCVQAAPLGELSVSSVQHDRVRYGTARGFMFFWFGKVWNKKIHVLKNKAGRVRKLVSNATAIPGLESEELAECVPVG